MVDGGREPHRDASRAELETRRARRRAERRRRQVRRRRIVALLALLGVVAAVVLVLGSAIGGGSTRAGKGSRGARRATASTAGAEGPVRNATPQPDWEPHRGPVPILEYHVLGEAPPGTAYPELFVARPDFRHQLEWLDENGYQAVTLEQVQDAWYRGGTLPPQPVVISFDDGYRPQFTFALPQLRKHGWAGVLNLKAEGSDLYDSNVEAMLAAGWELAAHTIHHLDLTELGPAELEEEVAGSRAILRREYGSPVKNFCYPGGRFDPTVIEAVEAAGYEGATTEVRGYG
ncbi:MAG TPA: polysaccharide deacetylase family protein [Solirubrobacterales bacterium]|nr:polysaccharide deacetylase family protein [Solirubrobacterales bacterium]